jgi:hypothetical protein
MGSGGTRGFPSSLVCIDNARFARRFPRARRNAPATVGVAPTSAGEEVIPAPALRRSVVCRGRPARWTVPQIRGRTRSDGGGHLPPRVPATTGCEAPASQGNSGCKRVATQETAAFQRRRVGETSGDPCRVSRDAVLGCGKPRYWLFLASKSRAAAELGARLSGEQLTLVTLTCARSACRDRAPLCAPLDDPRASARSRRYLSASST